MRFDGVNDFISAPNSSDQIVGLTTFSMAFWVNSKNVSPGFPDFNGFAVFRNDVNADFYILQLGATTFEVRFRNSLGKLPLLLV